MPSEVMFFNFVDHTVQNFTQISAKNVPFRTLNIHTLALHAYDQILKNLDNELRSPKLLTIKAFSRAKTITCIM